MKEKKTNRNICGYTGVPRNTLIEEKERTSSDEGGDRMGKKTKRLSRRLLKYACSVVEVVSWMM